MLTHKEIVDHWGAQNMRRWSWEELNDSAIPQEAKEYLASPGLPRTERSEYRASKFWTFQFNEEAVGLPCLSWATHLRKIGAIEASMVCVDEQSLGHVVCVDERSSIPIRLLNTNVDYLGQFLVLWSRICRIDPVPPDEIYATLLDRLEADFLNIDAEPLTDPESVWSTILEDARYGLS